VPAARRRLLTALALTACVATCAGYRPSAEHRAADLWASQSAAWGDPEARAATVSELRGFNAEWDFMWRTFFVLSLADRAVAEPEEADTLLRVMDEVIADTTRLEATHGQRHFLMDYVDHAPFRHGSARSVFVDGEIALMLAARRFVRDEPALAAPMWERLDAIVEQMEASPALLAESYPDEAWLFCNTNALVAVRMGDLLDREDHSDLIDRWTRNASENLREAESGVLGSEFTPGGRMMDGPEGSSIWLIATNLRLLDPALAQDQYDRARDALVRGALGHAYAREWGPSWIGVQDVDSGPILPFFEAAPASSGFALLAARAFGDVRTERALLRSMRAADVLVQLDAEWAALADNAVGDAVLLHALTFGPLWEKVERAQRELFPSWVPTSSASATPSYRRM